MSVSIQEFLLNINNLGGQLNKATEYFFKNIYLLDIKTLEAMPPGTMATYISSIKWHYYINYRIQTMIVELSQN